MTLASLCSRVSENERRFGGSTCDVISRGPDLVAFKSSGNQATSGTQWENRQAQRPCLHYHAEQDAVSARGNARQRYTRRRSFVRESPPVGETAIEWMLFTSEPIGTLAEIEAVVAHYPARWIIEEYFKALKTGCAFEKRQLCSYEGLLRALALMIPLAWTLLELRTLGRETTQRAATEIFSSEQLRLLGALLEKGRRKLLPNPTVRDAMLGIAGLGGHIKNNGDPGWQVLGRGFRRFLEAEEVWLLCKEKM